jgi:hypothetical protein
MLLVSLLNVLCTGTTSLLRVCVRASPQSMKLFDYRNDARDASRDYSNVALDNSPDCPWNRIEERISGQGSG